MNDRINVNKTAEMHESNDQSHHSQVNSLNINNEIKNLSTMVDSKRVDARLKAVEQLIQLKEEAFSETSEQDLDYENNKNSVICLLFKSLMNNLDVWEYDLIYKIVTVLLSDLRPTKALCYQFTDLLTGTIDDKLMAIDGISSIVTKEKGLDDLLKEKNNFLIRALTTSLIKSVAIDRDKFIYIINALKDANPTVISEALNSLFMLVSNKHALDQIVYKHYELLTQVEANLLKLLEYSNPSISSQAAKTLLSLEAAYPHVLKQFVKKDDDILVGAKKITLVNMLLRNLTSQAGRNYLASQNNDEFAKEMIENFVALESPCPRIAHDLVSELKRNTSLSIMQQCSIIDILGSLSHVDNAVINLLLNKLNNPNEQIIYSAIKALGKLRVKDPIVISQLLNLLSSENRLAACYALQALVLTQTSKDPVKNSEAAKNIIPEANMKIWNQGEIKNLVFSGGGAAGYAYSGVIEALAEEPVFSFDALQGVAGTSIGSVAALIVALKYTPKEAINLLNTIDLSKFNDGGNYFEQKKRVYNDKGRFKGDYLANFIKEIILGKIKTEHPEQITFADLKNLGFLDLRVVADIVCTKNQTGLLEEVHFSAEETPNTSVVTAIRASTAAPWYFRCVKMRKIGNDYIADDDGFQFIDGGLTNNYPVEIFDRKDDNNQTILNQNTLGLILLKDIRIRPAVVNTTTAPLHKNRLKLSDLGQYPKAVLEGLLSNAELQKLDDVNNLNRTIQINRLGVELDDFGLDQNGKLNLIQSGKDAVRSYFKIHQKQIPDKMPSQKSEGSNSHLSSGSIFATGENKTTQMSDGVNSRFMLRT